MATFTTNYNLRKPATSDYVTVTTDINDNMDDIDTQMKVNADAIAALDTRADAIEAILASETEVDAAGDLSGLTMDADWTLNIITGYKLGRMRFLTLNATYGGSTITGGSSGNISDETIATGLPEDWQPVATSAYFVFTVGGLHVGNGAISNTGVINLQSLHATATIDSTDTIAFTVAYFV